MIHDHGPVRTIRWSSAARLLSCTGRPPGATLRGVAADLGISRHTLQVWVHALDPNLTSPASEPLPEAAVRQGRQAGRPGSAEAELAELRARVAALETENAELLVEQTKLA